MSNTAIRADQWTDFARTMSPERETESPDCRRILPFPAIHTRSAPQMGDERIASGTHLPGGLVVERVLGRGSIGVVVSAITPRPHRRVAVKLLSNEWALDDEQRRRLL